MPFVTIYTAIVISIHAPRVGSDRFTLWDPSKHGDFYPRSPRGERRWWSCLQMPG